MSSSYLKRTVKRARNVRGYLVTLEQIRNEEYDDEMFEILASSVQTGEQVMARSANDSGSADDMFLAVCDWIIDSIEESTLVQLPRQWWEERHIHQYATPAPKPAPTPSAPDPMEQLPGWGRF